MTFSILLLLKDCLKQNGHSGLVTFTLHRLTSNGTSQKKVQAIFDFIVLVLCAAFTKAFTGFIKGQDGNAHSMKSK
uniref:Uncharacterized protein n=1 Tax=Anguilla anguilla TaxID=7936 RepID=A0A0E9WY41_ANGAN